MEEGPNIPPQTLRRLIMSKLKFNSYYRIVHADEIVVSKKYIIASILTHFMAAAIIFHAYTYLV